MKLACVCKTERLPPSKTVGCAKHYALTLHSQRGKIMAKQYDVEVLFTNKKTLKVWARDEDEATEKASEIVEKWENVTEVQEATCLGEAE